MNKEKILWRNNKKLILLVIAIFFYNIIFCQQNINVSKEIKNIKSKDQKIKIQAIDKLGRAKDKQAIKPLISSLNSEKDETTKLHILNSLGQIGDKEVVPEIKKIVKEDKSSGVRVYGCLVLGTLKDKSAVETLKEILLDENEDENVRVSAGSSLTFYIDEPGVMEVLEKILKGTANRVIKLGLVNSLRNIKNKEKGKSLLKIAVEDSDEEIRNLAKELIE